MLKVRIMPTLLYKNMGLVKGIGFDSWRRVDTILPAIKVYNLREVDELVFMDIAATEEGRSPEFDTIDDISDECFMPLTVGGGVKTLDDVRNLLKAGADKVSINSAAFSNPELISKASSKFGSQCIVVSIDVRKINGAYEVFSHAGKKPSGKNPVDWAREVESKGAGEILLTSVERDGTMKGYDLELIKQISDAVNIPVIASGGAGCYQHLVDAVRIAGASAVAAASIFHFTQQTPREAKKYMAQRGIAIRPDYNAPISRELENYKRPFPKVIRIELASACNLRCSHCPTGTYDMERGIMPQEIFDIVIADIKKNLDHVKVIVPYHGGESLLNKNYARMFKRIRDLSDDIFIKMDTNAMMFTPEIIRSIVDNGIDDIFISIDGTSPEENNAIRRGSDFQVIKDNTRRLIEYKIKSCSKRPNIYIATTQFVDPDHYTKGQNPPVPAFLSEMFGRKLQKQISGIKSTFAMRWPVMNIDSQYELFADSYDTEAKKQCDHIIDTITIRYNGNVVPCCYDLTSSMIMGNIRENELRDIWNNEKYINLRKSIEERKLGKLCSKCNVVNQNVFLVPKKRFLP